MMTIKHEWKAYLIYTLVSLLVMLPLLAPGFILTLDLVFTPTLAMPDAITSSFLFHTSLHVLNFILPSEVIEKIILLSILLLATIGMHRLIRMLQAQQSIDWGIYVASVFFVINPFTYSRFMAGQYAVLLGYALLPWIVAAMVRFGRQPNVRAAVGVGALATLIGIVSIHTLIAVAILAGTGLGIVLLRQRWKPVYLRFGVVAMGCFIILSSYWLLPLLLGQGKTATTIAHFTAADAAAFATTGDHLFQKIWNILRLQGFWAEDRNLFLLPQDRSPLAVVFAIIILGLVALGVTAWWRPRRLLVMWFGMSALIATTLAVAPATWTLHIPLLEGLREPHKMVMLVALFYAVFLAVGIHTLLQKLHKKQAAMYGAATALILLTPFVYMRVMLWGFDGQLSPRQYPKDWFTVQHSLQKDPVGDVLFLPWHQYMSFQFAGRIIATPAPAFFGPRTIVNNDPEFGGSTSGLPNDSQQALALILHTRQGSMGDALSAHDIRFMLLTKDFDYQTYDFLKHEPQLELLADYTTLVLYENKAWRQR